MKFTSKDLLKVMGLKIGDLIETSVGDIFEIVKDNRDGVYLCWANNVGELVCLDYLINKEYEILPQPKKVGDMKCEDFEACKECPLRLMDCGISDNQVLFDVFKDLKKYDDKEIEAIIEKRLNKEVK